MRYISHLGHTPNIAEPHAFKQGALHCLATTWVVTLKVKTCLFSKPHFFTFGGGEGNWRNVKVPHLAYPKIVTWVWCLSSLVSNVPHVARNVWVGSSYRGKGKIEKNRKDPLRLMQNGSAEPFMLWLVENPSSKLGYFQPATTSPYRVLHGVIGTGTSDSQDGRI